MKKPIKLIILIIIVLALIVAGFLLFPKSTNHNGNGGDVSQIDTSDWKTYRNEEYGFELKYPGGWVLENNIKKFIPNFDVENKKIKLGIGVFNNTNNKEIDDWIEENDFFELKQYSENSYVAHGVESNKEVIKINNYIKFDIYSGGASGGGKFKVALLKMNNKIFVISCSAVVDNIDVENKFIDILKSIIF